MKGDFELHGAVTVGERGQVVIPAQLRQNLSIKAGDKLLVFSGPMGGVKLIKADQLTHLLSKAADRLSKIEQALAESEGAE